MEEELFMRISTGIAGIGFIVFIIITILKKIRRM